MSRSTWADGQAAAVCLTYDDAFPSHFQTVGPDLEAYGFRGTFYLDVARKNVIKYADHWKALASAGHELGNHSCFHPCRGNAGRSWLAEWKDLNHYSKDRFWAEIQLANNFLQLLDDRSDRSYGNTCHDVKIGDWEEHIRISEFITELCVGARGPIRKEVIDPLNANFGELGNIGADSRDNDYILDFVDQAIEAQGALIVTFHAVGEEEHRLNYDKAAHDALLKALSERPVKVAPVRNVVGWMKSLQADQSD